MPKHLDGFEEIYTSANTAKGTAEKILNRAQLIQSGLPSQVQSIFDEFVEVKFVSG